MIDPGHDYVDKLKGLCVPLLAISFPDDEFAPGRAVDGICATMTRAELTRWHMKPESLGRRTLGHFAWVKKSEKLVERMSDWLTAQGL